MAGLSTMLGSAIALGTDLWSKNSEYQLERKKIEYQQAQERTRSQQAAAEAAVSLAGVAQAQNLNTIIKWSSIAVISLVGGNTLFRFLSKQLKGA